MERKLNSQQPVLLSHHIEGSSSITILFFFFIRTVTQPSILQGKSKSNSREENYSTPKTV